MTLTTAQAIAQCGFRRHTYSYFRRHCDVHLTLGTVVTAQGIVYLVGVALLGLFYGPVKSFLGGEWLFVAVVVAYLLSLRLIGYWVQKLPISGGGK